VPHRWLCMLPRFFTAAAVVIGNIGWPALPKNGFVDLHCLSGSHPGFDSIDPPGAKVGPGFVYWIARVTPGCVLDASIEITIGTEDSDCAFAGIRTLPERCLLPCRVPSLRTERQRADRRR